MSDPVSKSAGISRRRELAEAIFQGRFRAVAFAQVEDRDPGFNSALWPLGAGRLVAGAARGSLDERWAAARDLGVLALAWLEAIDAELRAVDALELPADPDPGRKDDVVGDDP